MHLFVAAGAAELSLALPLGLPVACMAYDFATPFPRLSAAEGALRGGVMVLGGDLRAARAGDIAAECRAKGYTGVMAGFGDCPRLETLRLCDALRRKGLRPYLTERAWHADCGAAALISTAVSGGSLRERLTEARERYGDGFALDLERCRRRFPLPSPDGEGLPLGEAELTALLRGGAAPFFSDELQCMAFSATREGETCFVLYDDGETLLRKAALAASLGVERAFVMYPEWSLGEIAALGERLSHGM